MLGACAGCMAIDETLTQGIEAILIDEVPEVTAVKLDEAYSFDPNANNGNGYTYY